MKLDKILAISKKPGLYKLINPSRGGYIVESISEKKKFYAKADSDLSLLSEISIYTLAGEVPLSNVFSKIFDKEKGEKTSISAASAKDELESYFFSVLPDFDEERVYSSDIKKILNWYNILLNDNFNFKSEKASK